MIESQHSWAYVHELSKGNSFNIFNLSPKDISGFYRRANAIGVWMDGSPLIHKQASSESMNGLSTHKGFCLDQRGDIRSQYVLWEGASLHALGDLLTKKVLELRPELNLHTPCNPTIFTLRQCASLPLHRDFDSGFRAVINLNATHDTFLDFENERLRIRPGEVEVFATSQWHGLNIHDPRAEIKIFTVCLASRPQSA